MQFKSSIEFNDHIVKKAMFSFPYDRGVIGWKPRYVCAGFVLLQGCYKGTLQFPRENDFFSWLGNSCSFFSHGWNVISSAYRGHVNVLTWSKRCELIEKKKLHFLSHMANMFPSSCNRNVIVATSQKCSPWTWKEVAFGPNGRNMSPCYKENIFWNVERTLWLCYKDNVTLPTWHQCAPLLQRKRYLHPMEGTLYLRYKRTVFFITWNRWGPLIC